MAEWDDFGNRANRLAFQSNQKMPRAFDQRAMGNRASDGLLDPLAFVRFVFQNFFKITFLAILLTVLGLAAFFAISFPYKATAIVLVDPREKGVNIAEQVISGIDGNAAVLESVIELIRSDGFLRPVVQKLDVAKDPQFKIKQAPSYDGDDRRLLAKFKKKLSVNRLGATYVVEIAFSSSNPEKSAIYANGVASAFVDQQATLRNAATTDAASSLSDRLVDLKKTLQISEKAVADFRANNSIISVDAASTLLQRELLAISAQVAQVTTTTEVARAQYGQAINGNSNIFNILGNEQEAAQLRSLTQQKNLISQNLAELNLIYGNRHPRITSEQSKLATLNKQLEIERRRLVSLSKQRLDAAEATQAALQADLEALRARASRSESALVTLSELEREAAANRALFEDFLSRFKSAEKQQGLQGQEARLASEATPPLRTTRPGTVLMSGVLGAISLGLSTIIIFTKEAFSTAAPVFKNRVKQRLRREAVQNTERDSNNLPNTEQGSKENIKQSTKRNSKQTPEEQKKDRQLLPPFFKFGLTKTTSAPTIPIQTEDKHEKQNQISAENMPENIRGKKRATSSNRAGTAKGKEQRNETNARLPDISLPLIPMPNFTSEFDLEKILAHHLENHPLLEQSEQLPEEQVRIILVGSWLPGEGKTTFAQALAYQATIQGLDAIVVKTPYNSTVERQKETNSAENQRPYFILDPSAEKMGGQLLVDASPDAVQAIIAQSRDAFDLVIIDAATATEETYFKRLNTMADKTFMLVDHLQPHNVNDVARLSAHAEFENIHIVLNNLHTISTQHKSDFKPSNKIQKLKAHA